MQHLEQDNSKDLSCLTPRIVSEGWNSTLHQRNFLQSLCPSRRRTQTLSRWIGSSIRSIPWVHRASTLPNRNLLRFVQKHNEKNKNKTKERKYLNWIISVFLPKAFSQSLSVRCPFLCGSKSENSSCINLSVKSNPRSASVSCTHFTKWANTSFLRYPHIAVMNKIFHQNHTKNP